MTGAVVAICICALAVILFLAVKLAEAVKGDDG